jgi:hypothetical protein
MTIASVNIEKQDELVKNLRENFLNLFPLLTPKQQKIWRCLHWYSKNYRQVFPSHEKLAKAAGCHRDTVIECLKKFSSMGWIASFKRCYRSSLYFIQEALIALNLDDPRTFRRAAPKKASISASNPTKNPTEIPTKNPTLYNAVAPSELIERKNDGSENGCVQSTEIKKQKDLPLEIKQLPVSDRDKAQLTRYSQQVLNLALEDSRTYKGVIRNLMGFLHSRCKDYLSKFSVCTTKPEIA